jgi:hypothetical protein
MNMNLKKICACDEGLETDEGIPYTATGRKK